MHTQWLSEIGRGDIAVAGGKGANLGEMVRLGLPVPKGFCITAQAYAEQAAAWRLGERLSPMIAEGKWEAVSAEASRAFSSLSLGKALEHRILDAFREMGAPSVAVRSSATAEDLAEASFAGQQETILNVQGEDDLLQAVRRCWASLWSPRALHYRHERGIDHLGVSMALVVQEMVPADAAGVMFTADPVTREPSRMLVEAAAGLGEAVVSGEVTGDVYRVDRTNGLRVLERKLRDTRKSVLRDDHLQQLARLGLELEKHFGCPQDVEFAVAGGELYLLQARPITTLAAPEVEPIPPETRLDRWQRMVLPLGQERYPIAPRPLDNLFFAAMIEAVTNSVRAQGFTASPGEVEELKALVWRDVYVSFPRLRPTWRLLGATGLILRTISRDRESWWTQHRDRLTEAGRPGQISLLSDVELVERADAILAVWRQTMKARFEFEVGMRAGSWLRALVALAVGPRRVSRVAGDLMTGIQTRTSETNERLWALSRQARQDPALAEAVAEGRFDDLRVLESGRDFLDSLSRFLADYGHREGTTWYLSTPTWRVDQCQVWQLLRSLLEVDAAAKTDDRRYEAALRLVEGRLRYWPWLLPRFRWLLSRLRALEKFREDSHFDLTRPLAALQELAAEWGRRLTDRGVLQQPDEVFFLTYPEVRDWLLGGPPEPEEARRHIRRRKATYRVVNDRWQGRLPEGQAGDELRGIPASAGTVRARARLVRGEKEWSRLRRGEIMVCPYTNPAWTPLFAIAAAVITETGGATAHAAIVAREYGIPAVMSVAGATSRIADGQEVLVNGETGKVILGALLTGGL